MCPALSPLIWFWMERDDGGAGVDGEAMVAVRKANALLSKSYLGQQPVEL